MWGSTMPWCLFNKRGRLGRDDLGQVWYTTRKGTGDQKSMAYKGIE